MEVILRLIGGSYDGQSFLVDEKLPVYRLPKKQKFPQRCISPDELVVMPVEIPLDIYVVYPVCFADGYRHHYGVCEPMKLVDAMNCMWDGYSAIARSEQNR